MKKSKLFKDTTPLIDTKEKFLAVVRKCYDGRIQNLIVGERLALEAERNVPQREIYKEPRNQYYYELNIPHGGFAESNLKYEKISFRYLNESEMESAIFGLLGSKGSPFEFDWKKVKFVKMIEIYG